ncbi:hypothetical protein [Ramlibacter albus]|uniref:Uncharacterized protein n=1 Tax=Ramlibacter albus TaxID=2079448 RepID=A0A923MBQ4_9BURK|nr:hypothetical protein [Ramlibacter albus]MBC5766449.1 hypothetical protein [Ramlibacter albus]
MSRSHRFIAAAAAAFLAATAFANLADAPPPLLEVARTHGDKYVFRVYCKDGANGRYVATMKIDLKAGTVNDTPYRIEGTALRWAARNAPAQGFADKPQERSIEVEGLRYTGPILGGQVGSFECTPSKERPPGVIFSP